MQEATNTQNLNRYTYVLNNPLGYTDPSGYFWEKLKPFAGVITSLALIHFTGGFDYSWFTASWQGAATAGAISGAVGAAVNGGDILTGGLTGVFSGAAFYAIGQTFTGAAGSSLATDGFHHVFAHGFTGGLLATMQGGKFGHGFVSAGLTKAINVNEILPGIDEGLNEARMILAALVGGSVSAVTGGKFANGATTAAIGQAFNGNSFWDKAKELGQLAITLGDGFVPGVTLANCALNGGCSYKTWAFAVGEVVGALTGVGVVAWAAKAAYKAFKSGKAVDKIKEIFDNTLSYFKKGDTTVYNSTNSQGITDYLGITNNLQRRAAEHFRDKGIMITPIPGMSKLSRNDARAVEQVLIEYHGLSKNGGTLMNRINSIAKSNPVYAKSLKKGLKLLEKSGYF